MENEIQQNHGIKVKEYILCIELIEKDSIVGYSENKKKFIKITLALPKHVPTCRGSFFFVLK